MAEEVLASEIMEQSQRGADETPTEVTEPIKSGTAVQEPASNEGEVVEEPKNGAERAAFSRQFANLARQERRFREEKQEFKGIKKKATELESLQEMASADPIKFLDKFGINYDALTRRVINDGNASIEDVVAQQAKEIAALKEINRKGIEDRENQEKKTEYETTYKGFIDKISEFVENNPKYETVLEYDQAANLVEQYYEKEAERYFKSSKLRDRYKGHWQPEPETAQDVKPSQRATGNPRPKTLSNQLTSQTPARDEELLSREESLARAAAIITTGPQRRSATFATGQANTSTSSLKQFLLTRVSDYSFASISHEAIKASQGNADAFIRYATMEIDGAIHSLKRSLAVGLYRDGSGSIGQTEDNPDGVVTASLRTTPMAATQI